MNSQELKDKSKQFALRIIKLTESLPKTRAGDVIARQVLRSATSVGANYRAACRARSKADFVSKITIVEEEADESLYWLEIIKDSGLIKPERLQEIMNEADELVAIFTSSGKTAKQNNPKSTIRNPGTETAFEVLAKAKALEAEGKSIIHLQIGEPDFPTPKNICDAAVRSIQAGDTHYTGAAGTPELRKTIAEYVSRTRGVDFTPDNVVMTPGAKPIMFFVILALLQHGDEAMYPNPGFPIYESMINFTGAKPVPIPLTQENNFNIDLKEFEKNVTDKTRLVIINTPGNPTGKTIPKKDIEAIAEILKNRDCMILSDEIYSRICYDGAESYSITKLPGYKDRTIILDGFSKTYAMTGWRAGYGIMNTELAPVITKLMVNSNSCNNAFVQKGCIEALTGPQDAVDRIVE